MDIQVMSSNDSDCEITQHVPDFKQGIYQQILDVRNEADQISIINEMVEKS